MRDLDKALIDIRAMRSQIARGMVFRGYGPAALATSGVLAFVFAIAQSWWVENPAADVLSYIALWTAAAVLSAAVVGMDVITRSQRVHSGLADEMIQSAVKQLLPAAIAGALLTFVLVRFAPQSTWMLPGLWQIILSLGVFASCRSLPTPIIAVAIWYLGSGLFCLAFASGTEAFSPWAMGVPFGIGQLLAAALIQMSGSPGEED